MTMSPEDFLNSGGSGVPAFSFGPLGAKPGARITGTIAALDVSQQTDIDTREPLTWPNGDPKMQLVVTLNTSLRDASIEDDDGQRRVFIKGKSMTDATRAAVQSVGAKGLEIGGTLSVHYAREVKPPGSKFAYRDYDITYERPNASAAFLGTEQPAEAAPAPAPAPSPDEASLQAALANLSPEVKAALLAQAAKAG